MTDFNDRNQRFGDDDPSNQRNFLTGSEDHRKVAPPIAKDDEYFADKTTGQSSVNYGHPGADYVQQKVNYGQYGATHIHPDVNFVPPASPADTFAGNHASPAGYQESLYHGGHNTTGYPPFRNQGEGGRNFTPTSATNYGSQDQPVNPQYQPPKQKGIGTLLACILTGVIVMLVTIPLTLFISGYWSQPRQTLPNILEEFEKPSYENFDSRDIEGEIDDLFRRMIGSSIGGDSTIHIVTDSTDHETVVAVHKLEQIISLLQSEYYIELSESEIVEAMAKGLPEMMDSPHTYYMSPEEYDMSLESDTGRYAGIGATIQVDPNNQVVVSDLHPNGPAEMAGIQIGDVFTAIDGDPIKEGTTAFELSLIVRGEPGTSVTISMYRPSEDRNFDLDITRAIIDQEIIRTKMLTDDIGYLWIDSFTNDLAPEFEESMESLIDQVRRKLSLTCATIPAAAPDSQRYAGLLLPKATLVTVEGRSDGEKYTEKWYSDASMGVPEDMTCHPSE